MKTTSFISFALLALLSCAGQADLRDHYPVPGRDPIQNAAVFEDHSEAFVHWAKKGIKEAILINIDTHDDRRWIQDEKVAVLKEHYRKKDWAAITRADSVGDESLFHVGNFIYAAAKLGFIRKVYWMIPFNYFSQQASEDRLRELLRLYDFSGEDIGTFRMKKGCFFGKTNGIPLVIFGMESIPEIEEPVILSIDADFFPAMAQSYGVDKLTGLTKFFHALFQKQFMAQDTLVAYSVRGGYLQAINRWLGDQCLEILRSPWLIDQDLPELWKARQRADTLYEENNAERLLSHALFYLQRYTDDPALILYAGFAYLGQGRLDPAYEFAKKACLIHEGFCFGLADMGQCLLDVGRLDEAVRFFECAYSLSPGMTFRNGNYANALKKAGRYREALVYFERYRSRNGSFPVEFLIGETFLLMGDESAALKHFDRGERHLDMDPYASVRNQQAARAIGKAIAFYEQKGLAARAEALKGHPKLKPMFNTYRELFTEGRE